MLPTTTPHTWTTTSAWFAAAPSRTPTSRTLLLVDLSATGYFGLDRVVDLLVGRCDGAEVVRFRRTGLFYDRTRDLEDDIRRRFRRHDRVVVITEGQQLEKSLSSALWALSLFEAGEQELWPW